jgi:hypothetical protein
VHRTSGKHHEVTTQGLISPRLRFGSQSADRLRVFRSCDSDLVSDFATLTDWLSFRSKIRRSPCEVPPSVTTTPLPTKGGNDG